MNEILAPHGGKVVDCLVIPDFVKLFKWESEKSDLEDLRKLAIVSKQNCFIPSYAKKEKPYESKMRRLEAKIDFELE